MICLYKKGNTHVIRGIECEALRCKAKELDFYLAQGYVKDPEELTEKKIEAPIEEVFVSESVEVEEATEEAVILEESASE